MKTTHSIVATKFCGAEAERVLAGLTPGEIVTLAREPGNKHDANAVQVWARGVHVGYLPGRNNKAVAMAMDADIAAGNAAGRTGEFKRSPNSGFPQVVIEE